MSDERHIQRPGEPMFNVPSVLSGTLALLVGIHLLRSVLSPDQDGEVLMLFSFIPARYDALAEGLQIPGGWAAGLWSFLTYGLLHADLLHLLVNCAWMLAFGSPVAWRFGTGRFLLFSAVTAIAGAGFHLASHGGEAIPMIGASAAISGHMGGAARFVFGSAAGPRAAWARGRAEGFRGPALGLAELANHPRALVFVALMLAINVAVAGGFLLAPGADGVSVAWQAHVGGFLAGILLFPLFDPVRRPPGPFRG
jgi:Uncharacterized membrane protein (homolog of Drosophila rhomboid)